MEPITFQGEAFSEYFCTKLIWTDPQLGPKIDQQAAEETYKKASSAIRYAQRQLRDREQARSTYTLLLARIAELLDWRLGDTDKIVTELEQEEEGGAPLLDGGGDRVFARARCIAPDAHLDAAPSGLHRRFAPIQSLARVLREAELDYGVLLNAYELRLVCTVGTLPSHIGFDLTAIAEGGQSGLQAWKLMHTLLNRSVFAAEPPFLDKVRKIGSDHQLSVSNTLGRQVQRAVVRFMQGVLDHPDNHGRLPETITDQFLHQLYQETLRYLYRLLFILYAEDLNLLPMDVLTYREGYSLNRLIRLARESGNDSLEVADPNGRFFQASLDALFALLRTGCHLGPEGEIKPYGGGLFDTGGTKLLNTLSIGNATIDNVIEQLIVIPAPKGHVGKVRLSYRELNVEQLGSLYEGLLEQTPAYAHERMWRCELDSRGIVIDDANRDHIRDVRGEKLTNDELSMDDEEEEELEDDENDSDDATEADGDDEVEEKPKNKSAKKPLKVLGEIPPDTVYLKGSQARKQSGSYYTNRAFVEFLVREALDPQAEGKTPEEILALSVLDPAMGSAHFLVGATRRLAEHLLAAYRRKVVLLQQEHAKEELSEDDLLTLAEIPDELVQVWGSADEERERAVCRLIVAGNCIYGVDLNPLAVDLAKVSLWLVTAASRFPLSFLDHRLRCGNSLLGIPAEEVVRPWVRPARKTKAKAKPRAIKPVELLISPKDQDDIFDFAAPSHKALCQSFTRAFACLRELNKSVQQEPTNFELHQARHGALQGTVRPWWEAHQLRIGCAFSQDEVKPETINDWLRDLVETGKVADEHRAKGQSLLDAGEEQGGFCWEMAFPEIFFGTDGKRREDAGFSCVLGNPPWDKIKPERDGFYLAYEPLIRQFQGTAKNRHIEDLHKQHPDVEAAWNDYESKTKALAEVLRDGGIYTHQTATIEEEVEGDDGDPVTKKKTTGGDPDCYKFFLERSWQLVSRDRMVGMVMSSSLHNGQGATGLRRLLVDECRLKALVKFDNELRVFPGVHNQFKFDIVVVQKGGTTEELDAAFFTRETELALQKFRSHQSYIRLPASDIRKLSPQLLAFFELRSQREVNLVQKVYRLHPTFGKGLMVKLGLKYGCEFHMGNMVYLFRTREWLRQHGGVQEPGEQWRANSEDWYRERNYIEYPIIEWYVLYKGDKVVAHKVPWKTTASRIRKHDLDDFTVRFNLPGHQLFGKVLDDGCCAKVFVPAGEALATDLPAYIPAAKKLKDFTIGPAIRPGDVFLPLVEAKWIHQCRYQALGYVTGSGSWVTSRPLLPDESDLIPQYFINRIDALSRVSMDSPLKVAIRDVAKSTDERTAIAAAIPASLPCGHTIATLHSPTASGHEIALTTAYFNSFCGDFLARLGSGRQSLGAMKLRAAPVDGLLRQEGLHHYLSNQCRSRSSGASCARSVSDAVVTELFELTPHEYAYILSTFPLLDRDQPPLAHDYRIRATNKGTEWRKISFITRDLALLTYFDYLADRLDVKPDPERVQRICPDGVPDPPEDIVTFFAEAGVDIDGKTDYAVAATGPHRNLRERVAKANELGAIAYIPTIDRRRATFVEQAATAGGLSPEEGVLTPEMAERVLRDKAERDAKWQLAMELWEQTPLPEHLETTRN